MARPARERINRAGVTLAPLDVPKAADVLADAFRRRIFADEWPEGTALPHERELAEQTNMSRHAVREAFRILEIQGLIRMRPGRGGGAFVHRPDEQVLAQAITLLIRGRRLQPAALHETREAIEPFCAELAAYHRTDDDLAALDEAVERMARTATSADFIEAGRTGMPPSRPPAGTPCSSGS